MHSMNQLGCSRGASNWRGRGLCMYLQGYFPFACIVDRNPPRCRSPLSGRSEWVKDRSSSMGGEKRKKIVRACMLLCIRFLQWAHTMHALGERIEMHVYIFYRCTCELSAEVFGHVTLGSWCYDGRLGSMHAMHSNLHATHVWQAGGFHACMVLQYWFECCACMFTCQHALPRSWLHGQTPPWLPSPQGSQLMMGNNMHACRQGVYLDTYMLSLRWW